MIREETKRTVEVSSENLAYRSGWQDGRFGPLDTFASNANLASLADLDRLSYYRGHREGRRIRAMLREGRGWDVAAPA